MRLFFSFLLFFLLLPTNSIAQSLDIDAKTVHVLYFDNIASEDDLSDVLPFQDFERQLDYLQKENYNFITLAQLQQAPPEKSVLLLLRLRPNDGVRQAVALLKRNGIPFEIAIGRGQNIRHTNMPILTLSFPDYLIDNYQQIVNGETSRFRQRYRVAPRSIVIDTPAHYQALGSVLKNYNFDYEIIPNGQATIPSQQISAIIMDKRTASMDVLENYLERRVLPLKNVSTKIIKGKNPKIAYGITLDDAIKDLSPHLTCQSISREDFEQQVIDDRVEIRLPMVSERAQNDLICTLPIFNKYNYKSDSYRYVRLYAPLQKADN